MLKDAIPDSTRTATAYWIHTFEEFCSSTGVSCKLEIVDKDTLSDVLERFYCGLTLRKKDGGEYKRSAYIAARGAIQRHLDSLEQKINLRGEKFVRCNKVLDAYLKDKRKDGREAAVQHKPSISDEDWLKLKEYFTEERRLTGYCLDSLVLCILRSLCYFVHSLKKGVFIAGLYSSYSVTVFIAGPYQK